MVSNTIVFKEYMMQIYALYFNFMSVLLKKYQIHHVFFLLYKQKSGIKASKIGLKLLRNVIMRPTPIH